MLSSWMKTLIFFLFELVELKRKGKIYEDFIFKKTIFGAYNFRQYSKLFDIYKLGLCHLIWDKML